MGLETAVKAIVDYFQNLSIIAGLKISWPPALEPLIAWFYYIRLDFVTKLNVDFRGQYLVLANVLPLVVAIILLAFFQPIHIIIWYIFLLVSIGSIIIGTVLLVGTQTPFSTQSQIGWGTLIGGIVVLICCVGAYGINRYLKKLRKKNRVARIRPENERFRENVLLTSSLEPDYPNYASPLSPMMPDAYSLQKQKQEAFPSNMSLDEEPSVKTVHKKRTFKRPRKQQTTWKLCLRGFIGSASVYFGLCLLRAFDSGNILVLLMSTDHFESTFNSANSNGLGAILGGLLFPVGVIIVVSVILNLFLRGRRFLHKLKAFFIWNMGTIIFLFLSLAYIPITTSLFNVFACSWETCTEGQELMFKSVTLDIQSVMNSFSGQGYNKTTACRPCNFTSTCPIANKLCPSSTSLRLNIDKTISCTSEIYPYYAPGAFLVFFILVVGLPYVYVKLTSVATKLLLEIPSDIAPSKGSQSPSVDEIWRAQMSISNNICRGLYVAYRYKWRYFGVMIMAQKLIVVIISTFKSYYTNVALYLLAGSYLVFLFIIIVGRPHIVPMENVLYSLFLFSSTLNAAIGIASSRGIDIPTAAQYIVAIGSLALPIAIVIFEIVIDMRMQKRLLKYLKEQKRKDDSLQELVTQIDEQLNAHAVQTIGRFFLAIGVASFLALCLAAISIIKNSANTNVLASNVPLIAQGEGQIRDFEFAGYQNWTQFTRNCCCEMTPQRNGSAVITELWKCLPTGNFSSSEFTYKVKKRADALGNGFQIRPYCGTQFDSTNVCGGPIYNATVKRFTVQPCSNDVTWSFYADYW